jgi:anaerobic selenocysteine-containing dehydrogenase
VAGLKATESVCPYCAVGCGQVVYTRNGELVWSFAGRFAEVRVDADLGLLRVARIVSAVDAGRILNEKLARSQVIGGTVTGLVMTMLEEAVFDGTRRIANATFGDYLIPPHADVPDLDVVFVGTPDAVRLLVSRPRHVSRRRQRRVSRYRPTNPLVGDHRGTVVVARAPLDPLAVDHRRKAVLDPLAVDHQRNVDVPAGRVRVRTTLVGAGHKLARVVVGEVRRV